jgi:hypothetical protein
MDTPSDRSPHPLAAWFAATQGDGGEGSARPAAPPVAGDDTPASRPAVSRRLILAAVVPWLIVGALGAAVVGRTPPSTAPRAPVAVSAAPLPSPGPAATDGPGPAAVDGAPAADTVTAADPRLAAAAVLTVRMALPDDQYLDTAVAEQVQEVAGAAVVTVAAVVLDRRQEQWVGPRPVRFAVPFSVGQSEPVALSAPWVVPGTEPSRAQPPASPVADDHLVDRARATLRAAGYRNLADLQLRRHPALPDILAVHVSAAAPGERSTRDHEIWLDAAASRVQGAHTPTASAPLPAPIPAEAP